MDNQEKNELLEKMADEAHEIWCGWMQYMFVNGFVSTSGTWVMDTVPYERWQRQMKTPYAQLSESEKESDREIAQRYLKIIKDTE